MAKIIELTFFGKVDCNGRLSISDKKGFEKYLLQFADFCTEVQQWSESKLNIRLPLPNEQWELKFL